jgi:hypothetical protein
MAPAWPIDQEATLRSSPAMERPGQRAPLLPPGAPAAPTSAAPATTASANHNHATATWPPQKARGTHGKPRHGTHTTAPWQPPTANHQRHAARPGHEPRPTAKSPRLPRLAVARLPDRCTRPPTARPNRTPCGPCTDTTRPMRAHKSPCQTRKTRRAQTQRGPCAHARGATSPALLVVPVCQACQPYAPRSAYTTAKPRHAITRENPWHTKQWQAEVPTTATRQAWQAYGRYGTPANVSGADLWQHQGEPKTAPT